MIKEFGVDRRGVSENEPKTNKEMQAGARKAKLGLHTRELGNKTEGKTGDFKVERIAGENIQDLFRHSLAAP